MSLHDEASEIARKFPKEENEKIENLRREARKFSKELKRKYPKLLERMHLDVFWEYDNMFWSDCSHSKDLESLIWDRMAEQTFRTRKKQR